MLLRTWVLICLLVVSTPVFGAADPPAYVEISVYRCATDTQLAFGSVGVEVWGPGWHYIEHLVKCSKL